MEYSPLDYEGNQGEHNVIFDLSMLEHGGHELSTYEEVIKIEAQKLHPRPIVLLGKPLKLVKIR